jgi:hypothetical protein
MVIDDPLDFEGDNDPLLSTPRPTKRYYSCAAVPFPLPLPLRIQSGPASFSPAGFGGDMRAATGEARMD